MDEQTKKSRILVVEDETFLRDLYVEILADEGYEVDTAADGAEGLKKIQMGGYDLILLDIVLPKMDGIEILKNIKANPPQNKNGSIVMLTNLGQEAVISEGVSLGVRGHIIKSDYTPDKLIAEVKQLLAA
ncbi:MAG: Sigma-54 dependent DNA-binding response regulator [Microgenomates group bacterium GW2011_GWC1_41_8]|uniref:Response regulator receiver protein n=2 Tax=Candidatus Roizmaniibacteriota TaxID=1752723 RepID=A0A0G0W7I5_9BACT|nr:MAG: Response regulator receiver protein [Candidatus Roizmanbacteria bacterium GW2011_GWB1_40_7]KKR91116.1 MAG: Response regulator receiver protein [Candidatus Roizmanbacteria bacterium GW2011_GWA1_41_13]KKS22743.1 MAG: Sigma-54 dependent DNA-binding response regulator [Microgenomates group bacterium GW2011_GWC1_41_8]